MKKGFTLIELLAVLVLVGVLALIGSVSVTKLINSSKTKSYQKQLNNIEKAAKLYVTKNGSFLQEIDGFETYITIEEIQKSGHLPKNEIIDPRTNKKMDGCIKITYDTKYQKYNYKYTSTCGTKVNYPTIIIEYMGNNDYIEIGSIFNIDEMIILSATNSDGSESTLSEPVIKKNNEVVNSIEPLTLNDNYTITYTALDEEHNLTSVQSISLKVVDTIAPVITVGGSNKSGLTDNKEIELGSTYIDPEFTITDNSNEVITIERIGKVNTNNAGTYEIKYNATDSSRNRSTYIVNVTVK